MILNNIRNKEVVEDTRRLADLGVIEVGDRYNDCKWIDNKVVEYTDEELNVCTDDKIIDKNYRRFIVVNEEFNSQ